MPTFEHSGQRVYYEETGTGEPLLLLPGWGGSSEDVGALREALAPSYRVISADLPGSGKSMPQPRRYTPSYFQEDAAVFLAMLDAIGASPAHIVGFSDGGEYALLMSALKPEAVRSVVTWGAGGKLANIPEMTDAFHALVDAPIPPLKDFSEYMKATYGEANARVMVQSEAKALRAIIDGGCDISWSRAAGITCPVLLITGEHDMFAPPSLVKEMAAAVESGEFIEAAGAGHAVHHERAEWFLATVIGWLARRESRARA
jgi:valacyclovir hydrolase